MRTITDHKVNGLNEALVVQANDEPGSGGANHIYTIFIPDSVPTKPGVTVHTTLGFQNGPIASPADFNGITNEALLAVVIDRMRGFCNGPFKCRENSVALTKLEEALMWLQKRARDRMQRGVEGSLKP